MPTKGNDKIMKKLFIAMIGLSLACGSAEEAPSAEELDEQAAEAAAALEETAEAAGEEAAEAAAEAGANAEAAGAAAAGAQMAEAAAALQEALAAGESGEGEGSNCERAYAAGRAMAEQFNNGAVPDGFPEESVFVSGCDELPEQEQLCLTPSYAMQNQADCQAALQSEAMAQFRASVQ